MTRRFLVPLPLLAGEWDLPPDEARHFVSVLRGSVGDEIELTDGAGAFARAEAVTIGRASARVRVVGAVTTSVRPSALELWCALPRAGAADDVVRVATEIGATVIRPLLTERGVWRPDDDGDDRRAGRFQKAAVAALKQCKGVWLPEILAPTSVDELCLRPGESALFGSVHGAVAPFGAVQAIVDGAARVVVAVGPEGGFTAAEESTLIARGARPVRIGRHVLRVETAVAALLTLCVAGAAGR